MAFADYIPHRIRLSDGSVARVHAVRADDGSLVRVLEVGGVYQSSTYLDERRAEPVFKYYLSFDAVFEIVPEVHRVLMIGGGGYAWPKHVLPAHDGVTLDVVEIESAITEAAKRWFFLSEAMEQHPGKLKLITADGRTYLDKHAANEDIQYDAIVIDAFSGNEPVLSLATVEAFEAAKACLTSDGVLLANVVSNDGGADVGFLRDMVATAHEVFADVNIVAVEDDSFAIEDNYLLVASGRKVQLNGAIGYDKNFLGEVIRDSTMTD